MVDGLPLLAVDPLEIGARSSYGRGAGVVQRADEDLVVAGEPVRRGVRQELVHAFPEDAVIPPAREGQYYSDQLVEPEADEHGGLVVSDPGGRAILGVREPFGRPLRPRFLQPLPQDDAQWARGGRGLTLFLERCDQ